MTDCTLTQNNAGNGGGGGAGGEIDGAGQDEAVVVVGVFADEVDATGRGIYRAGSAIEVLLEAAANVVDCEFHEN